MTTVPSDPPKKNRPIPRAEAIAAYQSGATLSELSRRYGVSEPRLKRMLQRRGVAVRTSAQANKLRMRLAGMSEETRQQIGRDYLQGTAIDILSRQHRTAPRIIQEILKDSCIPVRDRKTIGELIRARNRPPKPPRAIGQLSVQTLVDEYHDGFSLPDLSRRHGATVHVVRTMLLQAGVPLRRREEGIRLAFQRLAAAKERAEAAEPKKP